MVITSETRAALLDGEKFGFGNAMSAPKHFQERILEIRAALVEKRAEPAPSREYVRGAEQRSLLDHAKAISERVFEPSRHRRCRVLDGLEVFVAVFVEPTHLGNANSDQANNPARFGGNFPPRPPHKG